MKLCHFFSTIIYWYLCSTVSVTDHANPAVKSMVMLRIPKYKLLTYKNMPINVTEEYPETFFGSKNLKSILKYTEIKENRNITDSEEGADIVVPTSTERYIELKDATPTPKRKRSQGYSPNSAENNRPT